ncbi:gamma-glutamyltransferase [Salmonella enterica]|uniref:Glutathione hydrolase proenzyme n=1 Tax=Salmonella enterica subsp. diarizonae serovar 48:i:z TaxID=1192842 RepID=A0A7U5YCE0_SALDZ|nr:gamma-glutamyltransferase [Salmonella enterica]EAA4449207.1 gamma-glutamyltransferase [Salmonella enterica subsp. diarizonae]EDR1379222.1 gamma-glutamyltransferase [Salmonella enterica subsp. diarizonae serovar 61:r:z53]EDW6118313.1 gamma-glutamyltransferase [Salmonella enterica subsp. salamae]HCM1649199.1 gamma-glutamyltransferase [Salmonella enterica subsp. diarizonae serovar 48:i:z35]AXC70386.1 gamma-glutamyltransferase [Salmonella enterica subsp. diarizonae serovar 48:i:z]
MKPTFMRWVAIAALLAGGTFSAVANPPVAPPVSYGVEEDVFHPVRATQGMVASVDVMATQVGVDILKQGGNAVDAAVAVGYALAVTHPQAGNLGGGGFMLLRTKDGATTAIDFREMAPAGATRDMFLDEQGNPDSKKSLTSPLASGTPGTVAGFSLALEKYGSLPLNSVVRPAIKLAQEGFIVNDALADDLKTYGSEVLPHHENSKAIFWKDGEPLKKGDKLVQQDLANSLTMIAENGPDAFYKGEIARQIAQQMQQNGGLITTDDLAAYQAVERTPVSGEYRGYQIFSMPPPSSGGIHIVQILNILENFDMNKYGFGSADAIQIMAEAEKYAYADRSEYLGDPDFVNVPWQALTSKTYAKSIAGQIDINKAKPSSEIRPGKLAPYESDQTTHFSVVDKDGNAVAVTYTLNTTFGTGIVAGNTGILLNNQMDDFSAKPGVPNVYGLVGGEANAVGPKKRPLSSMSPTIVVKDGKTWLVTGSPGGSRIITTVLQMVVNTIDFGMNVAEATNAPRFHHQWLPDELRVEKGFSPDTLKLLEQKGQKVALKEAMGSTQSIMVGPDGELYGASDPRSVDDLTAGY